MVFTAFKDFLKKIMFQDLSKCKIILELVVAFLNKIINFIYIQTEFISLYLLILFISIQVPCFVHILTFAACALRVILI